MAAWTGAGDWPAASPHFKYPLPVCVASVMPSETRATLEPFTHLQTLSTHPFQQQVHQTGKHITFTTSPSLVQAFAQCSEEISNRGPVGPASKGNERPESNSIAWTQSALAQPGTSPAGPLQ